MNDRVPCERCHASYTRRGLPNHQRVCRAPIRDAFRPPPETPSCSSPVARAEEDRAPCERCGNTYARRGLSNHQRTCRSPPRDPYTDLYMRYVIKGALSGLHLETSSSSAAPQMHDLEDRAEVVSICQDLEQKLQTARDTRARVSAEMLQVGADIPDGPMRPFAAAVKNVVRPKQLPPGKTVPDHDPSEIYVITVQRGKPIACTDETQYIFLLLVHGLKFVPKSNSDTLNLLVPWPKIEEREAYASRVTARLAHLREQDRLAQLDELEAASSLHELFSC